MRRETLRGSRRSGRQVGRGPWRRGALEAFTLTELLVVVGLIAVMVSLLMPALGKVRAAAHTANCLSNLRQMSTAWTVYTTEHKGRLMEYIFTSGPRPEIAWHGYWPGVLESYKVRGDVLLCPSANQQVPFNQNKGFGTIWHAWTGRYNAPASVVRLNNALYRDSSYGYNRYVTAGERWKAGVETTRVTALKPLSEVPLFMDAVYLDFEPINGTEAAPAEPPPNLRGSDPGTAMHDHWRFLIARHGRAINVAMADGSARTVPLEETYMLQWRADWTKYRLSLPAH